MCVCICIYMCIYYTTENYPKTGTKLVKIAQVNIIKENLV